MPVAVVTDSTAHLPDGFAERHGIRIVPLHVLVDGTPGLDGVEVGPAALVEALRRHSTVTTSRPTPAEFAAAFRGALADGADEIVSVHLSGEISGTWESAVLAAREVGQDRVRIVDSRATAMGLGFCAVRAAEAAALGADGARCESAATEAADGSDVLFMVQTLEYLRRGGRIGAASALLGTALSVKPILRMSDGRIAPLEKVRTTQRALARLVELAADTAQGNPVDVAVHHLAAPRRAAELAERLQEKLPGTPSPVVSELGAVIGAHTGPGVLGVVVQR